MAVDMLVVVATTASTANPDAVFQVDFDREERMQKLEKFLVRLEFVCCMCTGERMQLAVTPVGRIL